MKKTYKKRYVLGVGYPFRLRVDGVQLIHGHGLPVAIKWPDQTFDPIYAHVPQYRLVLERVKPSKAGKGKRT